MMETFGTVLKLLAIVLAALGPAFHLRYHGVERGKPLWWTLAPYAGMLGAGLTVAAFVQDATLADRAWVGLLAALFYRLFDYVQFRNESYADQREYRIRYGPYDNWVDAYFDDETEVR